MSRKAGSDVFLISLFDESPRQGRTVSTDIQKHQFKRCSGCNGVAGSGIMVLSTEASANAPTEIATAVT